MFHDKLWEFNPSAVGPGNYNKLALTDSKLFNFSTDISNTIIIGSETWRGYSDAAGLMGNAGTCVICKHAAFDTSAGDWVDPVGAGKVSVVNYRRNVFESQYGGITHQARGYNNYVSISDLVYADNTRVTTYEGDTFISEIFRAYDDIRSQILMDL